jgi:hypothetical protein
MRTRSGYRREWGDEEIKTVVQYSTVKMDHGGKKKVMGNAPHREQNVICKLPAVTSHKDVRRGVVMAIEGLFLGRGDLCCVSIYLCLHYTCVGIA